MCGWDRWKESKFADLEAELVDAVDGSPGQQGDRGKKAGQPAGAENSAGGTPAGRNTWLGRKPGWITRETEACPTLPRRSLL